MIDSNGKIIESTVQEVLHNSMMPYAEHVILDRALPRVEDGLKPVQRRILYAMNEQSLTPDKPHKKCAKIVGDCLGKYHPHGDTSVYDALVRMAQDFNMRMTLVDGHGNFGSVDGDGAAAYRYTEARLTNIALELLKDIDKDTVNFTFNFDDTLKEPETLPGHYPNLLVNGASGIAVGLATNIPTHNLGEVIDGAVKYIENPNVSLEELMCTIKGPDFSTGGIIIAGENNEELKTAYETGRAKIKLRASVVFEKHGEKEYIVIKEIPYQVNKATLLKSIAELKESKVAPFDDISDVVDESDRNGMRAVIKIKPNKNAQYVLQKLYQKTDLETTFGINMVAIADGKPRQMGLKEILKYYTNYQVSVVLRRSKYELERAKERAHILEGLIIAVQNIDEVIQIIKKSENTQNARENLKKRFDLTEVQAVAILDLRLSRLTKLEITKLETELAELKKLIKELESIISSKKKQNQLVIKEMLEIKKKYNTPRKTKIQSKAEEVIEEPVQEKAVEEYKILITAENKLKKLTKKSFKQSNTIVEENTGKHQIAIDIVDGNSTQTLIVFTNLGNVCKIDLEIMPESRFSDKGKKLKEIIALAEPNEYPIKLYAVDLNNLPKTDLLFFTANGMIKKSKWEEYALQKTYYQGIKLKEDSLIKVEDDIPNTTLLFVTKNGIALRASKEDIPTYVRVSSGVQGILLNEGDKINYVSQVSEEGEVVIISRAGLYKKVKITEINVLARRRKGVKILDLTDESDGVLFAKFITEKVYIILTDFSFKNYIIDTDEITVESKNSKGKPLRNAYRRRLPIEGYEDIQTRID